MSTIVSIDDYDYNELTKSYMGIFYSSEFDQFLNTTQTGYAHTSSGIEFSLLVRTLFASLCFCTVQLTFFCFFRPIFKFLYQPRCYCVPINERMEPLPRGFINWILPILKYSINHYLSIGLDAYFFVRYISILLLFFIFVGALNMIILIPINVTGSSETYSASGLDKLSLSNIASNNVERLNAHFIMSLVTIGVFHWLMVYEFQSFVKIRQSYLLSSGHKDSILSRTLLISNVPKYLQDRDVLRKIFEVVPDGIKTVWFLYDFKEISDNVTESKEALNYLENAVGVYLRRYCKKNLSSRLFSSSKEGNLNPLEKFLQKTDGKLNYDTSIAPHFYPPIYLNRVKVPLIDRYLRVRLPGYLRVFKFEKRVNSMDWCLRKLQSTHESIDRTKFLMSLDQVKKHNKAFIEFNTQTGANIAYQCLLSQTQGALDLTLIESHPEDILWDNIARNNTISCLVEKYMVTVMFICIVLLYVVPVSFIGLVSQIPLLTQLIPSLSWVYKFPEEVRKTFSSFLPSILLSVLTEIVMVIFRFLTYFKGKMTGCEVELDLQQWYFAFLFVQQFLVVTISSSITVIFKQIVDQPISIPILLATNLPKAATFFFQYIALKAFAFCGNNFLRIDQLILHHTIYKLTDKTARQKFYRLTTLPKIKWGTVYPLYSVYASIGIAYCIISPLIAVFVIFILSLVLLYYKYALRYIYSHINESETQGRLYPVALLNLYTGIYCLECCLIGIFFLSRNDSDYCPMKAQGIIMVFVLLATIFGNITIYNRYSEHFSYLPILKDKDFKNPHNVEELKRSIDRDGSDKRYVYESANDENFHSNQNSLYLHPAFKYERPKVWLPDDPLGISEFEIAYIESKSGLKGGATKGAMIEFNKNFTSFKIKITEAPPDFK